MLLGSQRF